LRDSQYKGTATYDAVLEIATAAKGDDPHGYRAELLEMVRKAKSLAGQ
jgi:Ca-activated chloride channel homolog